MGNFTSFKIKIIIYYDDDLFRENLKEPFDISVAQK